MEHFFWEASVRTRPFWGAAQKKEENILFGQAHVFRLSRVLVVLSCLFIVAWNGGSQSVFEIHPGWILEGNRRNRKFFSVH